MKKMAWYIPITLLPGISLLLLSTATLTVSLNTEIKDMLNSNNCDTDILRKKLSQLKKLTLAKAGIYISIAMFVFAGLLAGVDKKGLEVSQNITSLFIVLGVILLLISLIYLITYSFRAVKIRQQQFRRFLRLK